MSRDYRHGHKSKHKNFQRRSQTADRQALKSQAVSKIWFVGVLVSVTFLAGFWVVKHFMNTSQSKDAVAPSKIYAEATQAKGTDMTQPKTQPVIKVEALALDEQNAQAPSLQVPALKATAPNNSNNNQPQYSFYQGLKDTEVVVHAVPISIELDATYYILAGTFGSENGALKEQKRLADLGQVVEVTQFTDHRRTHHRLMVGPFNDRLLMNAKRNELRRLGIKTALIKSN
mgnify:CR=1 FL=1